MEGIYPSTPIAAGGVDDLPDMRPTVGDLREPLELPVACTLNHEPRANTFELNNQNFGGDAKLTGGTWTVISNKPEGFLCADGSTAPTVDTYAFDDATLTGTHTSTNNAVCGVAAVDDQDAVHIEV